MRSVIIFHMKVIEMSQAPGHKCVTINVHVSYDQRPLEPIVMKKGSTKVKRDVVFEDGNGHVVKDVLKPVFKQLCNNKSYKLTNMYVGDFKSKVQFTSPMYPGFRTSSTWQSKTNRTGIQIY